MTDSSDYNELFDDQIQKNKRKRKLINKNYVKKRKHAYCRSIESDSSASSHYQTVNLHDHSESQDKQVPQNHTISQEDDWHENSSDSQNENFFENDSERLSSESEDIDNDLSNNQLYNESTTTYTDFIFAIYAVKIKHKLCDESIKDFLFLIKSILPLPNKVPKSLKGLSKIIENKDVGKFHEICLKCNELKRSDSFDKYKLTCFKCDICDEDTSKFVTYNIEKQLNLILTDECINQIRDSLLYAYKDKNEINNALDGNVYKNFLVKKKTNRNLVISLSLNTDGAQIVKSRGYNMWPMLGTIVELKQSKRESFNNMILFGNFKIII